LPYIKKSLQAIDEISRTQADLDANEEDEDGTSAE
jgi:hypothetical protein